MLEAENAKAVEIKQKGKDDKSVPEEDLENSV